MSPTRLAWMISVFPFRVGFKAGICRIGDFQVAGPDIEYAAHVGSALDVGMSAKCVDSTSSTAHIAQDQLEHGSRANDLRAEGVLRPANRVDHSGSFRGVAIFAY